MREEIKKFLAITGFVCLALAAGCGSDQSEGTSEDSGFNDDVFVLASDDGEVPSDDDGSSGIFFDVGFDDPPGGFYCQHDSDCSAGFLCTFQPGDETAGTCEPPPPTDTPWLGDCSSLDCEPNSYCFLDNGFSVCAPYCDLVEAEFPTAEMECLGPGAVALCDTDADCGWHTNLVGTVCRHDFMSTMTGRGMCMHPFAD